MQTFVPYADFARTARVLDDKRLGKQRVETIQIVRALTWPGYGWPSHPATLMWKGFEEALGRYGLTCCEVWIERGFGDTCAATIAADLAAAGVETIRSQTALAAAGALPPWLGDEAVLVSHRSALVRKDPDFYSASFPGVPPDLPYVWPVRSERVVEAERRKAANAALRSERAAARVAHEAQRRAEQSRKRRSLAAKRAWATRRAAQRDGG